MVSFNEWINFLFLSTPESELDGSATFSIILLVQQFKQWKNWIVQLVNI